MCFIQILPVAVGASRGENSWKTNTAVAALIDKLTQQKFTGLERSKNGEIVSVSLTAAYVNDQNLNLLSNIGSIQTLALQVRPNASDFTKDGIISIARLTNLVSIDIECGGELNHGIVNAIARLQRLQKVSLVSAYPRPDEYTSLTNLHGLVELNIIHCPTFGDRELSLVTNLTQLKILTLVGDSVTSTGATILRGTNFTKVHIIIK